MKPAIHCVRCGSTGERRGHLNPELHRVLYLCADLCAACTDELHEWWMLPPGAPLRAKDRPTRDIDDMRGRRRRRRIGPLQLDGLEPAEPYERSPG